MFAANFVIKDLATDLPPILRGIYLVYTFDVKPAWDSKKDGGIPLGIQKLEPQIPVKFCKP